MNRTAALAAMAAAIALSQPAWSDTVITGGAIASQTWTVAGSPYVVLGDVTIPTGATLGIEPGVEVRLATDDAQAGGLDAAKVEITVQGTLVVGAGVQFVSQAGSVAVPWYGIVVDAGATASVITGAIRHAVVGVTVRAPGTGVSIANLVLADIATCGVSYESGSSGAPTGIVASSLPRAVCVSYATVTVTDIRVSGATGCGIHTTYGQTTVDRASITASAEGICQHTYGTLTVRNSLLAGNAFNGMRSTRQGPGYSLGTITVTNSTIHGNQSGINFLSPGETVQVTNTIVTGNSIYGILAPGLSSIVSSNVFGNGTDYEATAVPPGAGTISVDPRYVDAAAGDFRLVPASPSVDTGSPAAHGALDLDGNPRVFGLAVDMGAYEVQVPPALADSDGDSVPDSVERAEGLDPLVKDNDVFANARLFVMQQYRDFLSREGDPAGIQGWTDLLVAGTYSRLQVIDAFLQSQEFAGFVAPVVRLYFASYLRVPDYDGLTFNAGLVRAGTVTLPQLADFFTSSPEFTALYGSLDNTAFVTLLYANVLGRAPDPAGLAGWVSLLNGGYTRGQVLLGFSDSVEYQAAMANEVFVTMMYAGMMHRTPEPAGFNGWVGFLDAATYTREQVINGFFLSTEYRARFLP